jgi:hypothetical protein
MTDFLFLSALQGDDVKCHCPGSERGPRPREATNAALPEHCDFGEASCAVAPRPDV